MTEQTSPRGSKVPWILGILGFLLVLPIVYTIAVAQSVKEGIEFSPDDFQTRHFEYKRIDWLNLTISGIQYVDTTSSFQQSLIDDTWIKPTGNQKKTWHLVVDSVTIGDSPDFDARILYDYLKMPVWSDWNSNKKNLKKAKSLWPAVATLARNYVYWAIPDLMDLAINQKSLSDKMFIDQVNQISAQALLQDSKVKLADGDHERAKKSIDAAVTFMETEEILAIRTQVQDELANSDSANADRKDE